ncbi:phosphonate metabolism transcriptional regulator PhnF [Parachitinimonas caeni]|uniref:Phosphonate metabolism transcriptional regulator PhnF n=1 Tax=Parachitinimonas caeni TaxID=3031301 RepID=A0ABT7DZV7_9NEIS|nr:phosphonate metabolism transcriptional regulator PhnF [Parachitinimonas caeni]MDK2125600.1 phosphonate metabolism transcriptional regulator PhnF [Parachitinimonas caeni]
MTLQNRPETLVETPVSRRTGTAVWRQIEEVLAADIVAGRLSGRLPNETELAGRFGVNRHTVRQAVKALAERGVLDVVHGKGTFVRDEVIDYQVGRRSRLAHSVARQRRVGNSRLLGSQVRVATADIQKLLELPAGSEVEQIDSWDVVDGRVIGVCTQYFPLPRFAGFASVYARLGKTHEALAEFGVTDFQRKLSRITARLPDRDMAEQLQQPATLPVLVVETVYVDETGQPIEYGLSYFSATSVQLVIEPEMTA